MMQDWLPETIAFYRTAAVHSDYYRVLAERVSAYLPPNAHVCDAGCGLGELSLALLPFCGRVTAIDRAAAPIEDLRRRAAGLSRMEILQGDIFENRPPKPYDATVFCLFGGMEETLQIAAEQCAGPVILIKRASTVHRFGTGGSKLEHFTPEAAEERLHRLRIPCQAERFALELGQPFRSLEEADQFFRLYNRGRDIPPEEVRGRLQVSALPGFPYYLPNRKQLGLIVFSAPDIRRAKARGGGEA